MNSKIVVFFIIAGAVAALLDIETDPLFPQKEVAAYNDQFNIESLTLDEIFVPEVAEYLKVVLPPTLHLISSTADYISFKSQSLNSTYDIIEDIVYRAQLLARLLQ
ncbi:unnamed protein product [Caenorhabditis angaria]|uniref:Uncharacterized protein n=1 Tax=Caenorhabditis angaria TaxID=860376 RepID=A0A9P1N1S5_9PELO|nr:unnamed protein product [Caenorhabditis angaria]